MSKPIGMLLTLAFLAGCLSPAGTLPAAGPVAVDLPSSPPRLPPGVHSFAVTVDGEPAAGLLAVPQGPPRALVVLCKGLSVDVETLRETLTALSAEGLLVLAMQYRGGADAFKVRAGADDTLAATLAVQAMFPEVDLAILQGGSMGGAVSAVVLAEAPPGTFDYWFDMAGTVDLAATWAQLPLLQGRIEAETGGRPWEAPQAYAERSAVHRAEEIARHGLTRAYLVYAAADAIVPADHGERLFAALREEGVPVSLYQVTTDPYSFACAPLGLSCAIVPAPSPAGHEVSWIGLEWPIVRNRVEGIEDPNGPAVRGVYDGTTGLYRPADA